MDNDGYGRYRGEVQITLCDLPADERVNVVGQVVEEDCLLLSLSQAWSKSKIGTCLKRKLPPLGGGFFYG